MCLLITPGKFNVKNRNVTDHVKLHKTLTSNSLSGTGAAGDASSASCCMISSSVWFSRIESYKSLVSCMVKVDTYCCQVT